MKRFFFYHEAENEIFLSVYSNTEKKCHHYTSVHYLLQKYLISLLTRNEPFFLSESYISNIDT